MSNEIRLILDAASPDERDANYASLIDAIDLASDQDTMTWVTDHGQRLCAIVPVDVAEAHEAMLSRASRLAEVAKAEL